MNRRFATILLFAFIVAAGCSFLVYRMVGTRVAAEHKSSTIRVLAAATDIKLGTVLTAADLKTIDVAAPLPKGMLTKPENAIGRGVISDLYQGEPILDNRLAAVGSGGGLAATIRQGMRACAIKVDEVVGVSGFVTAGMRVDVVISGTPPGQANADQGTAVKTLLQNIEVLSAGTDIQKDAQGKPQQTHVVNLLVTPEQAEVLSLASNQAHIQLVLRNPLDTQVAQVPGSTMGQLFSDTAPPPVKPHVGAPHAGSANAAPTTNVEVINGSTRTQQKFLGTGGGI